MSGWPFSVHVARTDISPLSTSRQLCRALHNKLNDLRGQPASLTRDDTVVDALKQVAELLVYGDRSRRQLSDGANSRGSDSQSVSCDSDDPGPFFSYFAAHNMLGTLAALYLERGSSSGVRIQAVQSVSIMLMNLTSASALNYVLGHPGLRDIVRARIGAGGRGAASSSDEELLAYYVSLLKTIALSLTPQTLRFFVDIAMHDTVANEVVPPRSPSSRYPTDAAAQASSPLRGGGRNHVARAPRRAGLLEVNSSDADASDSVPSSARHSTQRDAAVPSTSSSEENDIGRGSAPQRRTSRASAAAAHTASRGTPCAASFDATAPMGSERALLSVSGPLSEAVQLSVPLPHPPAPRRYASITDEATTSGGGPDSPRAPPPPTQSHRRPVLSSRAVIVGFPLFTESLRLLHHSDSMVRTTARTTALQVLSLRDEALRTYLAAPGGAPTFFPLALAASLRTAALKMSSIVLARGDTITSNRQPHMRDSCDARSCDLQPYGSVCITTASILAHADVFPANPVPQLPLQVGSSKAAAGGACDAASDASFSSLVGELIPDLVTTLMFAQDVLAIAARESCSDMATPYVASPSSFQPIADAVVDSIFDVFISPLLLHTLTVAAFPCDTAVSALFVKPSQLRRGSTTTEEGDSHVRDQMNGVSAASTSPGRLWRQQQSHEDSSTFDDNGVVALGSDVVHHTDIHAALSGSSDEHANNPFSAPFPSSRRQSAVPITYCNAPSRRPLTSEATIDPGIALVLLSHVARCITYAPFADRLAATLFVARLPRASLLLCNVKASVPSSIHVASSQGGDTTELFNVVPHTAGDDASIGVGASSSTSTLGSPQQSIGDIIIALLRSPDARLVACAAITLSSLSAALPFEWVAATGLLAAWQTEPPTISARDSASVAAVATTAPATDDLQFSEKSQSGETMQTTESSAGAGTAAEVTLRHYVISTLITSLTRFPPLPPRAFSAITSLLLRLCGCNRRAIPCHGRQMLSAAVAALASDVGRLISAASKSDPANTLSPLLHVAESSADAELKGSFIVAHALWAAVEATAATAPHLSTSTPPVPVVRHDAEAAAVEAILERLASDPEPDDEVANVTANAASADTSSRAFDARIDNKAPPHLHHALLTPQQAASMARARTALLALLRRQPLTPRAALDDVRLLPHTVPEAWVPVTSALQSEVIQPALSDTLPLLLRLRSLLIALGEGERAGVLTCSHSLSLHAGAGLDDDHQAGNVVSRLLAFALNGTWRTASTSSAKSPVGSADVLVEPPRLPEISSLSPWDGESGASSVCLDPHVLRVLAPPPDSIRPGNSFSIAALPWFAATFYPALLDLAVPPVGPPSAAVAAAAEVQNGKPTFSGANAALSPLDVLAPLTSVSSAARRVGVVLGQSYIVLAELVSVNGDGAAVPLPAPPAPYGIAASGNQSSHAGPTVATPLSQRARALTVLPLHYTYTSSAGPRAPHVLDVRCLVRERLPLLRVTATTVGDGMALEVAGGVLAMDNADIARYAAGHIESAKRRLLGGKVRVLSSSELGLFRPSTW